MTALFWLLLAVFEFPCSAYREEKDLGALQVEPSTSAFEDITQFSYKKQDALQQKNAAGACARSEEEAIERLAKLWGYRTTANITECKQKKNPRKLVELGVGFSVSCDKKGSIVTLAIKQKSQAKIVDLNPAICGLPELKVLILDGSNISGHLEDLQQWNRNGLIRLHLRWCNLKGTLNDLKHFTNLMTLKLSGLEIRGSLEDLGHLRDKITFLDLGKTSVEGNLFGNWSKLEGLWLQNTLVTGGIMQILNLSKELVYLNLASTKVNGSLRRPEDGIGKNLKELILSGSDVKSGFNAEDVDKAPFADKAPFPKLTILDVTSCNLSMDVWDFVYPFAKKSSFPAEFKAAHCNLSGPLKGIFRTSHWPMSWKVNVLDLSHNKITKLEGEARGCWLDVSYNPLMAIDRSYFEKTLLLDMRSTNYNASNEEAVWDFLEPEDVVDPSKRCKGVKPKSKRANTRVLVTPSTFASKLCNCTALDFEEVPGKDCCGCRKGTTQVVTGNYDSSECVSCFGPGCDRTVCFQENSTQEQRHKQCKPGYTGPVCAACKRKGYRSNGFGHCAKCSERDQHWRGPMLGLVAAVVLLVLGGSLWFWVWREPGKNTATEQGLRFLELLEQFLLMWTYLQLLVAVLSLQKRTSFDLDTTGEDQRFKSMSEFIMFDVAWVVDMLSFECMLGYEEGLNLKVVASALFLPALVLTALTIGIGRWGSPFYGLKYAIVITSAAFQSAMQTTWGNLFWCQTQSPRGLPLGGASFLRQRPWIRCSEAMSDDPLRSFLLLALSMQGIMLPACLCLLGMYITGKIRGIQSLSASFTPVIQCDSKDASDPRAVTLHFATIPAAAEKLPLTKADLGIHADFPSQALWIYAAAYAACIADSIGSQDVEVMEARFGGSHNMLAGVPSKTKEKSLDVLKLKLTKGPNFQEAAVQAGLAEGEGLSKILLHRAMAKQVMAEGQMEALWIGTRNSFERFADKDPLLCECLWKLLLLCMTKMLLGNSDWQLSWVATAMAACAFGVHLTKPFGSRSRNTLATLGFGALSSTCAISALLRLNAEVIMIPTVMLKVFTLMPTVVVILFFVHLQLMPGDILLQANWLQANMKQKLGASKGGPEEGNIEDEDQDESPKQKPQSCLVPLQTSEWAQCPEWLSTFVQWYRGLASSTLSWYGRRSCI